MPLDKKKADPSNATLVEVGPRFAMQPIKIFAGSFGGSTLYENPNYTAPNTIRRLLKQQKAGKYGAKVAARSKRRAHVGANQMPVDELDEVFK
jgi:ribosome biogenesis protein BRX1